MEYDWTVDAIESWKFWCRMMALAVGARQFTTCAELYFVESRGGIP